MTLRAILAIERPTKLQMSNFHENTVIRWPMRQSNDSKYIVSWHMITFPVIGQWLKPFNVEESLKYTVELPTSGNFFEILQFLIEFGTLFPAIRQWSKPFKDLLISRKVYRTRTARRRRKFWEFVIFDRIWSTFPAIRQKNWGGRVPPVPPRNYGTVTEFMYPAPIKSCKIEVSHRNFLKMASNLVAWLRHDKMG